MTNRIGYDDEIIADGDILVVIGGHEAVARAFAR